MKKAVVISLKMAAIRQGDIVDQIVIDRTSPSTAAVAGERGNDDDVVVSNGNDANDDAETTNTIEVEGGGGGGDVSTGANADADEEAPTEEQQQEQPVEGDGNSDEENKKNSCCWQISSSCSFRGGDVGEKAGLNGSFLLLILFLAVVVVMSFTVIFLLDRKQQRQHNLEPTPPTDGNDNGMLKNRLDAIKSTLIDSVSDPSKLIESGTPQSKALSWLVYEDTVLQSSSFSSSSETDRLMQRYAVIVLAFATNVELWRMRQPWHELHDIHECYFPGIDCSVSSSSGHEEEEEEDYDERVIKSIDLGLVKISGSIPDEIGLLTHLTTIMMPGNKLVGTIPETIYTLTKLEHIDLSINDGISSTISSNISNLQNLKNFLFARTDLSGTLPESIVELSSLERLYLYGTRLQGPFFDFIVHLPNLVAFEISFTHFTGTIPSEIAYLTKLESFFASRSLIEFGFQAELLSLTNLKQIHMMQRTVGVIPGASIPPEIGNLAQMEELALTGIEGRLPTELGLLTNLTVLSIEHGSLDGGIPSELGLLTNLWYLTLSANELEGTIPTEIGLLAANMTKMRLQLNSLEGRLPIQFCDSVAFIEYDCQVECDCCLSECYHGGSD